jgi:TetR/AcrR family transcriptional repressor of nem operon
VNKGSFYYFFKSKTDLVAAAYEEHWQLKKVNYEKVFASEHPPLKRLELWCDYIRATQKQREKRYGHVCGCPYASVGGELATQDKKIRLKTQDLIERNITFLVGTIGDAMLAGEAEAGDAQTKAELVHAFAIGLLLRAKIYNDLKVLNHLEEGIFALIRASRQ